jgi:hypothetical protein
LALLASSDVGVCFETFLALVLILGDAAIEERSFVAKSAPLDDGEKRLGRQVWDSAKKRIVANDFLRG